MNRSDCNCEVLVNSEIGHVAICAQCDQVHLTLQFATFRFESRAFDALAAMINRAQHLRDAHQQAHSKAAAALAAARNMH